MMNFRPALAWMVLVLIAASAVRFAEIDRESIWFDEGWSAYAAAQPTLLDAARADLTNPPLYYMLLHTSARFFGDSEYALRWVSSALNLITIALIYVLTRRLFYHRAGVYAAAIAACSALLWWASREARMYTLLALFVVVAALAWHRLLERPARMAWLMLWAAELALLYSHNTGPIAAIWLNLITLIAWVSTRGLRRPDWRIWIAGQFAVVVLWLPWLSIFLGLSEANAAIASAPTLSGEFALAVWQGLVVGVWSMVVPPSPALVGSGVLFVVILLVIPWRSSAGRWLLLHFLLLVGGVIAGLIILGNDYHGRYAVMAAPLLLAALGAGIAQLRWRVLHAGVLLLFAGGFIFILVLARSPQYGNDNARGMVHHYADTLTDQDTVIAWSYADRYDLWYYWERLGVRARRITMPEGAEMAEIVPRLPVAGDSISLNVWYTQRADYRGMLPCLLSHLTARIPDEFTTNGMTTLRFREQSPEQPIFAPQTIAFALNNAPVARVIQVSGFPDARADQAICVPIQIQADQPIIGSLSAALIARNALGWEIARADAIIATADQRTALGAGELAAAFPLLRLPYGAPAGEYRVYMRLYNPASMESGYVPSDPSLTTSGRDVLLGAWRAAAADWNETSQTPQTATPELTINQGLRLLPVDVMSDAELRNGDAVRLSLLWLGSGAVPRLTLGDSLGRWELSLPPSSATVESALLDWRQIRIPNDAPEGEAFLALPDGRELSHFVIRRVPALYDAPPTQVRVNASFPALGRLNGYTLEQDRITLSVPPDITLVWRAGDLPIQNDYTVFVQLLNREGIVIAQNDAMPANGERPTGGWRAGEYILDRHRLTYNALAQPGEVRLIVGWYDAVTNRRLLLEDGSDALPLDALQLAGN